MQVRVLVCGGRDFGLPKTPEYWFIQETLDDMFCIDAPHESLPPPGFVLIHGGAWGADIAADCWAINNFVQIEEYPADWKKHGKKAGILRNIKMLEEGKPDLVVAFPGGRGTAHMVKIAKEAGVKVIEVKYE